MKTIMEKDPATSDGIILRVHPSFLLVNALVCVDIDRVLTRRKKNELIERSCRRWLGLFMQWFS